MTPNILSMLHPTPIEIIQTKGYIYQWKKEKRKKNENGNKYVGISFLQFRFVISDAKLMVYITGLQETPLMTYIDVFPLQINFISFATYDNEPANWFYDCEFDGFQNELEPEVKPLTPQQRIGAKLKDLSQNATIPSELRDINITLQLHALNYKTSENLLQARFDVILVRIFKI